MCVSICVTMKERKNGKKTREQRERERNCVLLRHNVHYSLSEDIDYDHVFAFHWFSSEKSRRKVSPRLTNFNLSIRMEPSLRSSRASCNISMDVRYSEIILLVYFNGNVDERNSPGKWAIERLQKFVIELSRNWCAKRLIFACILKGIVVRRYCVTGERQ